MSRPDELAAEAIADVVQALEDLTDMFGAENPDVWDAAADLLQGASGLLTDAARAKRGLKR